MFNLDNIIKNDNNKDWPYRKLIIGPSGSGKTNYLLNSIQKDSNIMDKIFLHAKGLEDSKYKLLINKRENQESILIMILVLLLSTLILWIIFYQILKIITKREKGEYLLFLMI